MGVLREREIPNDTERRSKDHLQALPIWTDKGMNRRIARNVMRGSDCCKQQQ